ARGDESLEPHCGAVRRVSEEPLEVVEHHQGRLLDRQEDLRHPPLVVRFGEEREVLLDYLQILLEFPNELIYVVRLELLDLLLPVAGLEQPLTQQLPPAHRPRAPWRPAEAVLCPAPSPPFST